jgi:hypothetical protein
MAPDQHTLERRVARAIDEARQQVRKSEVLLAARGLLDDQTLLLTRCAWCRRHALAGYWLEPDEVPAFLPPDLTESTTHGICPRCTDELRRTGRSR